MTSIDLFRSAARQAARKAARRMGVLGAVTAAITLAACSDTASVTAGPTPVNPLFRSYVALGNSITAGYQSGGINDSTQRESYAHLFAMQVNTRYAYASLAGAGCPPPVILFPVTRADTTTCSLRNPASITDALNNVAVPGATSYDPTAASTPFSNALTTFILGGKTQVQRAADARPTFVSAWIGNNDVLAAAISGILVPATVQSLGLSPTDTTTVSPGLTDTTTFKTNYDAMITGLNAIGTIKGGALIGVVNVTATPILFPAAALANPAFKAGFDQYVGTPTTIHPSCTGSTSLISFRIVSAIRTGQHPAIIACSKNAVPGTPIGDIFVLDAAEQATLLATVASYNAHIQSVATTQGWAYYDPNTTLATLIGNGCILPVMNLASQTQTFGACVSLDGVHPSGLAHKAIANDLIDAVNAKYGTSVAHVQ